MNDWRDIQVGTTYRFRYKQELDRTVISVDKKKVVFQCHENGEVRESVTCVFIKEYNKRGIPMALEEPA